ncbi:uncharacterized protein LOC124928796 [Impatiens glandulifera]|uniref:uncharacterized protein LOC124928796 n=1 Tax=Impatiens glandulifera TaxID=253017 RepID=UPI001FB0761A|nr:uncharacterized protein LOC124928796 [Impatiens glandulifera]
MAAEVGLSVLGKIGELLIEPIQRELGYLFCFNNNFQELQTQLEKLIAMKNDVQTREDAEMRKRNTLGESVKLWIVNADGIVVEAESLLNEKAKVQKGCFSIKWCPNISLRFSLGRKGKKLSLVIIELVQAGAQLPQTGHALTMPPINMRDYNGDARDFNSRGQIVEDIIEKLRDEKTMLIGICGMGGIGKTTLAKQVLQKVEIPCLEFLNILFIPNIETLPIVAPSLSILHIDSCGSLRYVFSEIFLISISHLENLSITNCKMLKGLIGVSKGVEEESKISIEFPNLKRLDLASLDKLTSFVMDINNLDVEEKKSQQKTLFDHDEVKIPCLEILNILSIPNIETLHIVAPSLNNLYINSCDSLRYVFSESLLISISHLESLSIKKCKILKGLIGVSKGVEDESKKSIEFPNLKRLDLASLDKLTSFVMDINNLDDEEKKSQQKTVFGHDEVKILCLEVLNISSLLNIESLHIMAPSLNKLDIDGCDSLRYVFTESFLMSISDLEKLSIKKCKMLKGLIGVSKCVEEESKKSIEFSNLKRLDLASLDKLTSFVMEINNLDDEEEKLQQRTLFDHDEVSFPCLDVLYIFELPKINYIVGWKEGRRQGEGHHHHPDKIFHVLSSLMLYELSNLIHVYEINQPDLGVLLFQNLTYLRVGGCGKLRYLFSENIGRVAAKHLDFLEICKCGMMEVVMKNIKEELIIEDHDDDDDKAGGSNFPLLETLYLGELSGLRSFSEVAYTWALPLLRNLAVYQCPKLEALSPDYLDSPMLDDLQYDIVREKVNVKNTWKGDINAALRHLFIKKETQEKRLDNMNEEDEESED